MGFPAVNASQNAQPVLLGSLSGSDFPVTSTMDLKMIATTNRTDKVFCPGDNRNIVFKAGGVLRDADHGVAKAKKQ